MAVRTCDRCGARMSPYQPRKRLGDQQVCEGCHMWAQRTSVLHNPTGELRGQHPQEWYHGSPHEFEEFGHPGSVHWNTFLGTHFSAQPEVAKQFAYGEHQEDDGSEEMPAGHVVSAKLHIKHPKAYRSEFEMDQAAHEWAHGKGYLVGKHIAEHPEEYQDDEPDEEYDEWGDDDPEEHERKQIRDARMAYAQREDKPFHKHEADFGFPTRHSFRPAATGWLNSHPQKEEIAEGFKNHLKSQGHDGIVYGNEIEQHSGDAGSKHLPYHSNPPLDLPEANRQASEAPQHNISAVAFEPHQIQVTKHEYDPEYKTWGQKYPQDKQQPLPSMERESKREVYRPPVHVYYHGTANEPGEDTSGEATHVIPSGAHVHADEHTAWKHAINQWREDESSSFPRVYRVHTRGILSNKSNVVGEPTTNRGLRLTKPAIASEQKYDPEKHPPIRLEDEPEHILYHGTTHFHDPDDEDLEDHEAPEEITPRGGRQTFGPGIASPDHAYATRNPHTAWTYAEKRRENVGGTPHVYRVTPKNPHDVEEDPHFEGEYNRGNYEGDMRSPSGFNVLDEVPPTRQMHQEMKQDHHDEYNEGGWDNGEDDEDDFHHEGAWKMRYTRQGPQGYEDVERDVEGPLYHGSRSKRLDTGDLITPGRKPNSWGDEGPKSTHVYFADDPSTAQSYADQAGGYVYEVEPTGEFKPDYHSSEYKTQHPLRVLRRYQSGRTAANAEEYAKQDAGRQDVWQVQTEGKVQPLCDYHCQAALGRDRAANSLGAYYDLGQEPSGRLSGPEKGSCAHCGRNTDYVLKGLNRGNSRFDYHDSQQPRTRRTGPYMPTKTKPFTPVIQSTSSWDDDDEEEPETYHCPACGEDHEDEEERERHMSTYTDWDQVYPHLNSSVHRVLPRMKLPRHVHDVVHDESRPMRERGESLLGHVQENYGHGLGMHWSDVFGEGHGHGADKFAGVGGGDSGDTQVVLHAHKPAREHIEEDPDTLDDQQVYGYDVHDENEVPIQRRAPVHVTGISWRPGGYHQEWKHHHLDKPMEMTAMRKQAHDATENQDLRHCPFCGSGKIIGRADGSIECEFCHSYFTVQVQPQFSNFPQTINGEGTPPPGMPGQVEEAGVEGGAPGEEGGFPPGDGDEDADDQGEVASDEDAEGDQPFPNADAGDDDNVPFAKQSFRTVTGARLDEDAYVRHLAITLATDRSAMIAAIRRERGI